MSRTDAFVDVDAVRICTHCIKVCFQVCEQTVDDRRSCPVCRIQADCDAGKIIRNGRLQVLCVFQDAFRIFIHRAQSVCGRSRQIISFLVQIGFDLVFLFVRQFEAIRSEEFNTVIACRIMRSRDHDPCNGTLNACQVSHARCRDDSQLQYFDTD